MVQSIDLEERVNVKEDEAKAFNKIIIRCYIQMGV